MWGDFWPYLKRFTITLIVSLGFVLVFNEIAFLLQGINDERAPQSIELVIPAGTADKVNQGISDPAIPAGMNFVDGDVLVVRNEDRVDHQLGPLYIPAGHSASLKLSGISKLSYQCSFSTSNYFGLDIRPPVTIWTRLTAAAVAAPTLAVLVFLYSLVAKPIQIKSHRAAGFSR